MGEHPEHLLDVYDAAIEGATLLRSSPKYVEFTHSHDQTVRIRIKAQPGELWKMQIVMWIGAGLTFALKFVFGHVPPVDGFDPRPSSAIFLYMGFGFVGISILLLLLQVNAGPDRDTLIELSPGQLKLDRYAAGDNVLRTCSAAEVRGVMMGQGEVTIFVPTGEIHIAYFVLPGIRAALVAVIASGLWQDNAKLIANLKLSRQSPIPLYAYDGNIDLRLLAD